MKLTNNHNPRERERESKLLRQAQDKSSSRLIQFIKKESHKPFFYASLFFALLLLLTVIYQLAFSWNPPTAGAPGPSGQTLYSDTNRNIGIGTLYPSVKLEIYSTSSDSILKLSRQSATSTLFKVGTDSAFVINSNGADRFTISPSGNVQVAGIIESTSGGIKFPDGTTQITAGGGDTPSGAVMFFNLASCPSGWTVLAGAQGRYLVGLPSGGTLAGTAGTVLSNLENRPVGQHSHGVTDPGHSHSSHNHNNPDGANSNGAWIKAGYSDTTGVSVTGISIQNSGSVAGTNAPYIQFLVCQKD